MSQLRAPCVELSSTSLRFRGRQATAPEVLRALEPVYSVLKELAEDDVLDEKLAEYCFFPLSHIFNETQRISARCLELAVNCLRILVKNGWKRRLSPQMGKQLIILLTLIVGGTPQAKETSKSQPEELVISGYDCLSSIFEVLEGQEAERMIFHEIGTATIVDQTVYILLEGIVDERSDDLCLGAARALHVLYGRIKDRVVLASMMPRTVSVLTRVLKPTSQRRSYRLSVTCLHVFTHLLKVVLSDRVAVPEKPEPRANERMVLDESWLKATTSQIKLALANAIQIRRHERPEVQDALLELCIMVIEDCHTTLQESLPMMVETVVVLSEADESTPNTAFSTLKHLATTYPSVLDSLKDSLHQWITSFPRAMKGNDETTKQWAIRQISTTFQILSQVQSKSDILTTSLASGLCDSVAAAVNHRGSLQPLDSANNLNLDLIKQNTKSDSFPPILLEHRSQQQTLWDLQSMIARLNMSDSGAEITRSIINQMHNASSSSVVAPFWLALTFLKKNSLHAFEDFISFDDFSLATRSSMIEELYCISLPILNEPMIDTSQDWRVPALALEVIALQSQQLGEAFRPELMDALYPTLQFLASGNPALQRHAMTCLNILTHSCNYPDAGNMIIDNVDYLVNAVGLKLNTFDVSPHPPQVLLMMVKLCGPRLLPYLDDLVDAVFGILNLYHGYPKLVELMFKTLAAIVEEGTKGPSLLAITEGDKPDHQKRPYERLQMSTLAEDFAERAKRIKEAKEEDEERISHPKQPWGEVEKKPEPDPELESLSDLLEKGKEKEDDPLPPPTEPNDTEKPLSKSHTLLLHIVKSIPSHLSSPSPYLRRSLLAILNQVLPILSYNENSFLPLINDLWPSITSKITFPTSFTEPASASLTKHDPNTKQTTFDYQEEIYVITTACEVVSTISQSAGDFVASRVETEYPRWERLYKRAWERVRSEAEKAIQRRAISATSSSSFSSKSTTLALIPSLSLTATPSPSSNTSSTTPIPGGRGFTPHHTLWRSLISLFATLITHTRLPIAMGDQICHFLSEWVALYAGVDYYFDIYLPVHQTRSESEGEGGRAGWKEVERTIEAMESWNADLVWFCFWRMRVQQGTGVEKGKITGVSKGREMLGGRVRFVDAVF